MSVSSEKFFSFGGSSSVWPRLDARTGGIAQRGEGVSLALIEGKARRAKDRKGTIVFIPAGATARKEGGEREKRTSSHCVRSAVSGLID